MYYSTGSKIKTLAGIAAVAGMIVTVVICGMVINAGNNRPEALIPALGVLLIGVFVSYISYLGLAAFGELVMNSAICAEEIIEIKKKLEEESAAKRKTDPVNEDAADGKNSRPKRTMNPNSFHSADFSWRAKCDICHEDKMLVRATINRNGNLENASVCQDCFEHFGGRVCPDEKSEASTEGCFCPKCGTKNKAKTGFCFSCGSPLNLQ